MRMAYSLPDNKLEELTSGLSSCSIDDFDKIKIGTKLKELDIHFNWNLHQIEPGFDNPQDAAAELNRTIEVIKFKMGNDSDERSISFNFFCYQLTLAQELIKYDTGSALTKVLECEPWVANLKNGFREENEFVSISEAVEYIYLGCKAFVLFNCGSIAEAKEVLQKVPDLNKMKDKQLSGIFGIKACAFYLYGSSGYCRALEHMNIARTKHPNMAHWHFMTGIIMNKIRHRESYFSIIPEEEVNYYRTAYKSNKNDSKYAVNLAKILCEKACELFKEYRDGIKSRKESLARSNEMNTEALSLYTKVIKSDQNDAKKLALSAFGLAKMPKPFGRIDLAKKAIEKALLISPDDAMVNHYAGLIFQRHLKDNVKGLKYLEIAADMKNYPASMDLLKLKYFLDPKDYDPIPELTSALLEYKDYFSSTIVVIVSWYLFMKHDVFRAWEHLKKITVGHLALNHKSYFLKMKKPCNLYEVIFDEVKSMIAREEYENEEEKETLILMRKELQTVCSESHPTEFGCLLECILNESDRIVGNDGRKPKARSDGRGRGRGNMRSGHLGNNRNTSNTRGRISNYFRGGSFNSGRGAKNSDRSSNQKPVNTDWWIN